MTIHAITAASTASGQQAPRAPSLPLVAILRGLAPAEALDIGKALYAAGFRALEVPLNRPGALECIASLADKLPADTLIGGPPVPI